jgi:L-aspartate oxidase
VVETAGVTVIEGARAATLWVRDGRCVGVVCEDGRAIHARAVILATGRLGRPVAAHDQPAGLAWASACCSPAAPARRSPTSSSCSSIPPPCTGIKGREGFLVTEAIRGEGATLLDADGERFVEELAPRDEVARAIWSKMIASGRPSVDLDMRAVDPALFPNVVGALREAGLIRPPSSCRRAAAHYGMGGIVADLDGATTVPGPLRGRRERVHRPARRQPPGLQLAERVLRLRGARRARRLSEPRGEAGEPPRRPGPRAAQPRDARGAVAPRRPGARRRGARSAGRRPAPAGALIARHALLRARAGRAPRSDLPGDRPGPRSAPLGHARRHGRARLRALGLAATPPVLVNGRVS